MLRVVAALHILAFAWKRLLLQLALAKTLVRVFLD